MLNLIKANNPFNVLILFIFTLILKFQALGHSQLPLAGSECFLFGLIVKVLNGIWGHNEIAFTFFAVFITYGQALYLNHISVRHRLFHKASFLPAFIYIMICSLHPSLGYFSAPLLLNWLLLGGLDTILFFTRKEEHPRAGFNAGLLYASAAVFFFPAIGYLLFFLLALLMLRPFRIGEWVISLLGYLTPFYFAAGLLYLFNKLPEVKNWPALGISLPVQLHSGFYVPVLVIGMVLLLSAGFYTISKDYYRLPVTIRQSQGQIIIALLIGFFVCVFTPNKEPAAWIGIAPYVSLIIVPPMLPEKHNRFATFTFYSLILLVIICQLTLR